MIHQTTSTQTHRSVISNYNNTQQTNNKQHSMITECCTSSCDCDSSSIWWNIRIGHTDCCSLRVCVFIDYVSNTGFIPVAFEFKVFIYSTLVLRDCVHLSKHGATKFKAPCHLPTARLDTAIQKRILFVTFYSFFYFLFKYT